jgi:4-hydroxymandelate oxidase
VTQILRLDDFEELAKEKLEPGAYAYYAGGAGDEITLRENVDAFARRRLRPRVLVDVSSLDPTTTFLGTDVPMPVALAPNADHSLAHPEGEVATARAASKSGALMCLSTFSARSLQDVAAVAENPLWFQLYAHKDKALTKDLVQRAVAEGYRAIVLTVDLPVIGYRERELRHPIEFNTTQALGNFAGLVDTKGKSLQSFLEGIVNDALTWEDLEWLADMAGVPVALKGVLTGEDADLACEHGAAAVIVSNHGGRQLDKAPATIDVLEEVVQAVGDRAEVYLDGGVRRGTDVVTALALGARGVFFGRPYLFALAAMGEGGVELALDMMRAEVLNAMALLGARNVSEITRSHVV